MNRAPWWPSSPGWNMNSTRPASSSRRSLSSWAAPDSIAVCVSWPQACMHPSTCDAKSRPVSSGIGSASMSPRRRIVGPGRRALEQRHDAARRLVRGDRQRQAFERRQHLLAGDRQVVAELRPLVQPAAQGDRIVEQLGGLLAYRLDHRILLVADGAHRLAPMARCGVTDVTLRSIVGIPFCAVDRPLVVARRHPGVGRPETEIDDVDVRSQPRPTRKSRQHADPADRFDHPDDVGSWTVP